MLGIPFYGRADFNAGGSINYECKRVLEAGLPLPAYDYVLKCSHAFNLLDARGVISATERMAYILRVRTIAKACCASYLEHVVGVKPAQDEKGE